MYIGFCIEKYNFVFGIYAPIVFLFINKRTIHTVTHTVTHTHTHTPTHTYVPLMKLFFL
jgi:hypothetical protein